jgi:hypothetical protein
MLRPEAISPSAKARDGPPREDRRGQHRHDEDRGEGASAASAIMWPGSAIARAPTLACGPLDIRALVKPVRRSSVTFAVQRKRCRQRRTEIHGRGDVRLCGGHGCPAVRHSGPLSPDAERTRPALQ